MTRSVHWVAIDNTSLAAPCGYRPSSLKDQDLVFTAYGWRYVTCPTCLFNYTVENRIGVF